MKKIAIISLYGDFNYGNKLQNYAVQQFYRSMGFDTTVIKTPYAYTKDIGNVFRRCLVSLYNLRKHYMNFHRTATKKDALMEKRKGSFRRFAEKYISETDFTVDKYNAKKLIGDYDYYSVGSDQVWNPMYVGADPLFYAAFAPESKRLSIAASLGIDNVSSPYCKKMAKYISEMRLITVRENTGADIVKELTGRDCEVILDPTLLINVEQWSALEEKPKVVLPGKYVFTYLLGDVSEARCSHIEEFAKKHDCKVISFNDRKSEEFYTMGPSEFLYLINHAEYVVTDSFHCTVFSMLYGKCFSVLKKVGKESYMLDRLYTLLSTFGLSDRIIEDTSILDTTVDYSGFEAVRSAEAQRARDIFLQVFEDDERIV